MYVYTLIQSSKFMFTVLHSDCKNFSLQ